jgi:hypothetical protein
MSIAFRDIAALAAARRSGTTLESEKKKTPSSPPQQTSDPDVSSALDALRAVLPATLITLYSTGVIVLQNAANSAGADDRAARIAALTKSLGAGTPELVTAVKGLSAEPDKYGFLRAIFAAAFLVFVAYFAFRTAQIEPATGKRKRTVYLEPLVSTAAFVAWAIASPGTFLAAYLNTTDLALTTILVAFLGAGGLYVISNGVLKKKAADAG